MLELGIFGWIFVGLIAGAISGALVGGRTARGCLPNIVVGIIGGVVGGWLAQQMGFAPINGLIAAIVARHARLDHRPAHPERHGTRPLTDSPPADAPPAERLQAERPYSPGLEGVIAGETDLSYIDGERGRLLYRGYRIGDLVERGTYAAVANLLWTGDWDPAQRLPTTPVPPAVLTVLRALPTTPSRWTRCGPRSRPGARRSDLPWPPTVEQARALTAFSPSALAAFARLRAGKEPVEPDPDARPGRGLPLPAQRASARIAGTARALDAYFIVGAEHGFNASTFTARVITSTRSDIASAVVGAIGAMKGPLHGGAPSEVVDQLAEVGSAEHGRGVGPRGARPRRAADGLRPSRLPRVRPAGRGAAQGRRVDGAQAGLARSWRSRSRTSRCGSSPRSTRSGRSRRTSSSTRRRCCMGVGLTPDLFPATFSLARHAGWTAHVLEQAADNRLIRPDVNYVGPAERDLPG